MQSCSGSTVWSVTLNVTIIIELISASSRKQDTGKVYRKIKKNGVIDFVLIRVAHNLPPTQRYRLC